MRRRYRRRADYTAEQEASRKALHRAEMWLDIVSNGIADGLKRERYYTDGTRSLIGFVNAELVDAANALDAATKAHDENFPERRSRRVVVVSRKNPKKAKTKKEKAAV